VKSSHSHNREARLISAWAYAPLRRIDSFSESVFAIRQIGFEVSQSQGASMGSFVTFSNAWYEARAALLGAGQLAGIGFIIELVDQIRWNFLHPDKSKL
jgi:hypothetical protein